MSHKISVGLKAPHLFPELKSMLTQRQIPFQVYPGKRGVQHLVIRRAGTLAFATQIGFLSPKKQHALAACLQTSPRQVDFYGSKPHVTINSGQQLDFFQLPKLRVVDAYSLFCRLLEMSTDSLQEEEKAMITHHRRSWYRSKRVPFRILALLAESCGLDIYEELIAAQARFIYPYCKLAVHLPSTITPMVTKILPYLTPVRRGLILTTGAFRKAPKRERRAIVQETAEMFALRYHRSDFL